MKVYFFNDFLYFINLINYISIMEIKKGITPDKKVKYPFSEMEVNDCLEVKSSDVATDRVRVYTAAAGYSKYNKLGWKFSAKAFKNEGIVRLWRIK